MPKAEAKGFREALGLVFLSLALLTFLSLISSDPNDVSWNTSHPNDPIANFIGPAGAYLSALLFRVLGLAAYFIPLLCGCASAVFFARFDVNWSTKLGWTALFLISASCLIGLQSLIGIHWAGRTGLPGPGGWTAEILDTFIYVKFLGPVGAGIVLFLLYGVSLIMLFEIKPVAMGKEMFYLLVEWWEQRQEAREDAVNPSARFDRERRRLERQQEELERQMEKELARKRTPAEHAAEEEESASAPAKPEPKVIDTTAPKAESETKEEIKPEPTPEPEEKKPAKPRASKTKETLPALAETPHFENYRLPGLDLLTPNKDTGRPVTNQDELKANSLLLVETLRQFDIEVTAGDITKGATITRYEVYPAPGVRVDRIVSLQRDLARAMKAEKINILAPIPGKDSVGIEIANNKKVPIVLHELFETPEWTQSKARIPLAIGKDVYGRTLVTDLGEMPHLLIAGTTGSGKSVCINCIILSFLYRFKPEELRLILVDPKQVEMQIYENIPHLVVPVVTEPKKVLMALRWVINEMEKRYRILAKVGVRNISTFNSRPKDKPKVEKLDLPEKLEAGERSDSENAENETPLLVQTEPDELVIPDRLPYVVVIIDELADLMQTAPADVENAIARLAQKARAAGIHLILATQTPRAQVITGMIKMNVPSRIAFQVPSALDSRVVLDEAGAENLLGKGDMMYLPPGSRMMRGQGAFVSDEEVKRVVDYCASQAGPAYETEIHQKLVKPGGGDEDVSDEDGELLEKALEILRQEKRASTSLIQRRLRIGYNRAAWLMDYFERIGVVGPDNGAKPREILVNLDTFELSL